MVKSKKIFTILSICLVFSIMLIISIFAVPNIIESENVALAALDTTGYTLTKASEYNDLADRKYKTGMTGAEALEYVALLNTEEELYSYYVVYGSGDESGYPVVLYCVSEPNDSSVIDWKFQSDNFSMVQGVYYLEYNAYTVAFDDNTEDTVTGTIPNSAEYVSNAVVTLPTNLERENYIFLGWALTSDATSATHTSSYTVNSANAASGTITLYAIWKYAKATIVYDTNGATSGDAPTDTTVYDENSTVSLKAGTGLVKTDYKFLGWALTDDATVALVSYAIDLDDATLSGVITLYAVWQEKKTITFDETVQETGITYVEGSGYIGTTPYVVKYNADGATLDGFTIQFKSDSNSIWYDNVSFATYGLVNVKITRPEDDTYKAVDKVITHGFTVYTKWVEYHDGGADSGTVPATFKTYSNENYTILAPTDLVKEGYTFGGWVANYAGSVQSFPVDSSLASSVHDTFVLYPQWILKTNEISKVKDYTASAVVSDNVTGYQWYLDSVFDYEVANAAGKAEIFSEGGTDYGSCNDGVLTFVDFGGPYGLAIAFDSSYDGVVFKFKCSLTTLYGFEGGTNVVLVKDDDGYYSTKVSYIEAFGKYVVYIMAFSAGTITDTRISLVLDGENEAKLGAVTEDGNYLCGITYAFNYGNFTYTNTVYTNAVKPNAITFDGNEETSGSVSAIYELEGRKIAFPKNGFTKTGYKHIGWNTDDDATSALSSYTMGSSNVTLYAIWQEKTVVSITETAQEKTYNGTSQSFDLEGTHKSIGSFVVEYYVDSTWVTTAPTNSGSYDVKITRNEDDTYKTYEKEIANGLVIKKAQSVITVNNADIVVVEGTPITIPVATANFGEVTADKKSSDLTSVGTYVIKYTIVSTDNYYGSEETINVIIQQKKVDKNNSSAKYADETKGFDPDVTLVVTEENIDTVDVNMIKNAVNNQNIEISVLYDVALMKDGVEITPAGEMVVSLAMLDSIKNNNIKVVSILEDNTMKLIEECQVIDGKVVFSTNELSSYAIIIETETNDSSEEKSTGEIEGMSTGAIAGISVGIILLLIIIYLIGAKLYKDDKLKGKFFEKIYFWVDKKQKNDEN